MNSVTKIARYRALFAARRWLAEIEFLDMDPDVRSFHRAQARADLARAEKRYLEAFRGESLPDAAELHGKE
jgi:hypothetical protein